MTNASKSMSARLGHVKRRIVREEPLAGDHMKLALDVLAASWVRQAGLEKIARRRHL